MDPNITVKCIAGGIAIAGACVLFRRHLQLKADPQATSYQRVGTVVGALVFVGLGIFATTRSADLPLPFVHQ